MTTITPDELRQKFPHATADTLARNQPQTTINLPQCGKVVRVPQVGNVRDYEPPESKLHKGIAAECKRRGWLFIHSRMDRKTTTGVGVPDFLILADRGRLLLVEAKRPGKKLSPDQNAFFAWALSLGHTVHVVRSKQEFLEVAQ